MNLQEIKAAIEAGKKVFWKNNNYPVIKDRKGQYLIDCINGCCIGLFWSDGKTLNGNEKDFYIEQEKIIVSKINSHEINMYRLIVDCETNQGNKELEFELSTTLEQVDGIGFDMDDIDVSQVQSELDKITDKMISDILDERKYNQ